MLVIKVICHKCTTENLYPIPQFKEFPMPNGTKCFNCKTPFFEFDDIDEADLARYRNDYAVPEELV